MRSLLVIVCAALLVSSCTRKADPNPPCSTVMCTMMFAAVGVEVKDANGEPVVLDEVYTQRIPSGERIEIQQTMSPGNYIILDDGYRSKLQNTKANFYFVGKKNGTVVVNEVYTISADCCHVKKESGEDTVTVN